MRESEEKLIEIFKLAFPGKVPEDAVYSFGKGFYLLFILVRMNGRKYELCVDQHCGCSLFNVIHEEKAIIYTPMYISNKCTIQWKLREWDFREKYIREGHQI